MATKNDITGDSLISKTNSEAYRNNYDLIFGKKEKTNEQRTRCVDGELESGRQAALHSTKDTPTENEGV